VPPDGDWDSWNISSWSSENIRNSKAALEAVIGNGVTVPSADGQLYLQSSYDIISKSLSTGGYSEVDLNSPDSYNRKSKVSPFPSQN